MLLAHEGGFVNHPKDPGGMTNLGVTKKVYENWLGREVSEQEMRNLTITDVAPIYKTKYWDKVKGDSLPSGVDWAVFDWAVNSGTGRAARMLQKVVGVTADGAIGPMTLAAVNKMDPAELIEKYCARRQAFYERLSTFSTFGKGWTRRVNETRETALNMA